jgi:putative flippase GtrA
MAHNKDAKAALRQMMKFAVVGVLNTLVDFAVFQTLNLTLGWVYVAQVIGYVFGVINSYIWNSKWTFREQRTHSLREMVLFLLVNLASLGVSLGMIWLCREVLGVTDEWVARWMPQVLTRFIKGDTVSKLIATVVAIAVNYLGNRLLVFRNKTDAGEQSNITQTE